MQGRTKVTPSWNDLIPPFQTVKIDKKKVTTPVKRFILQFYAYPISHFGNQGTLDACIGKDNNYKYATRYAKTTVIIFSWIDDLITL